MNQIEVMKRALDLIDSMEQNYGNLWHINLQPEGVDALGNDLRQAIEQAGQQRVGWLKPCQEGWFADIDTPPMQIGESLPLYTHPPTAPAQPEQGCACRWDANDKRVATCVRHQGWLDVVSEWAERAKAAEAQLNIAAPAQPLSDEQKMGLVTDWFAEDWAIKKAIGLLADYEQSHIKGASL